MRILAETRNRKHSRELFKILRESYDDVQVLGYYDSPEDYVAGNLQSSKFESVEDETPFEGQMNIQYNQDLDLEDIQEDDSEMSQEDLTKSIDNLRDTTKSMDNLRVTTKSMDNLRATTKSMDNLRVTTKLAERTSRASSRLS